MAEKYKPNQIVNFKEAKMRRINPSDLYLAKTPRLLRSSVTLPSQYNSYAVCTEFARDWFLDKFPLNFFNSIYMDGSKTFDQFRMLSKLNQQLKRTNPLLGIVPTINMEHSREWIDSNMELTGYFRRTRMDGTFFSDMSPGKGLHLAIQFKSIKMNFTYKMRVDTRAQQLDLVEYIKYKHRAGMTETQAIPLEIHVPKKIIAQIAFDNGLLKDDYSGPRNSDELLRYLNSHSVIPFLYKRRNATGTNEFFIRVENCSAHIKADQVSADDGDRQDHEQTNFTIEFPIEIEMTAPFVYTYYSEREQTIINSTDLVKDETGVILMRAARMDLPEQNELRWDRIIKTDYIVENEDLRHLIDIDFHDLLEGEINAIIEYNKSVYIDPSMFIDFLIMNNGTFCDYEIDWDKNIIHIKDKVTHPGFAIGVYCNMKYINELRIHHNFAEGFNSEDSFRTTSRIGKIE